MMAVSLSANSSIQHNSNKTGSGYVLLKLKHAKKGINQKNYNFCDIK